MITKLQLIGEFPSGANVELDTTLTQSGKAADAKVVGDVIGDLTKVKGYTSKTSIADMLLELFMKAQGGTSGGTAETLSDITGTDIPEVSFTSDIWGEMTKENPIDVAMTYVSDSLTWSGYANIKWQGASSLNYDKKNYTVKLYEDETMEEKQKINFNGWGLQNKFCLKANYIDHSHARNIVSARLWSDIVESRSNYSSLPEALRTSPNNGAIDGFPIKVTVNGAYQGIYTWNIPKDGWTFSMDDENASHCALCCEYNWNNGTSACEFRANAKVDGSDWSVEFPDTATSAINISFNNLINVVKDTTDDVFYASLDNYLDVQSAIDYYLYAYFGGFVDSLSRNMMVLTYDGVKWYAHMYDMDSTWGIDPEGDSFYNANVACPEGYRETKNLLWERIEKCFAKELKERLAILRADILSVANVVNKFTEFMSIIPSELYKEDLVAYPSIPSATVDHLQQITEFVTARAVYVDEQINALDEIDITLVPVTGVEVTSELTLPENGTGVVEVTVFPENASNKAVTFVSSNGSVATADDSGTVTTFGVGTATITVTTVDGGFTDTCLVTVQEERMKTVHDVVYNNTWTVNSAYNELDNTVAYQAKAGTNRFYGDTLIRDKGLSTIENVALSIDGFARSVTNTLKNTDAEGFTLLDNTNAIIVRIAKNKLNTVSVDGMAEYIAAHPLNAKITIDTDLYEFESFKLSELTWTVYSSATGKFKCTNVPFDFTNDSRVMSFIQSNDDIWSCFKGDSSDPFIFSSFTGQACMVTGTELIGEITLSNFIKYLTEQNVKLVYVKAKS